MTTETATRTAELGSLRQEQARLRAWLARKRRSLRLQMALEFALDAAAGAVAAAVVLVALDYWFRLGVSSRQILLGITLAGLAIALAIRLVPRFRAATLDDLSLAMTLDRVRPGIGQQVADVLQLPELLGRGEVERVAGPGAPGRPARERGPGRRRSRHALELGPDGGAGVHPPRRPGDPCRVRPHRLGRGPAQPGAMAHGVERALAPGHLSLGDRGG